MGRRQRQPGLPAARGDRAEVPNEVQRQRLDKWLWFARMVKTRGLAADLASSGHVRVNGRRADGAGKAIKPGDVLTIALGRDVRVLRVEAPGLRRGPFSEARLLYTDLAAPGPGGRSADTDAEADDDAGEDLSIQLDR